MVKENSKYLNQGRQERFPNDFHRPQYHFLPPSNWMNDPNGFIQWKGQYHIFFQYNPYGPFHNQIHWGHAVSSDLVHWTDLPVALAPSLDGPDSGGCWSGCAADNNGVPTLLYTGVFPQAVSIATSDDEMIRWQKYSDNPVIAGPPKQIADHTGGHFRDPFVWKDGDQWYLLMGSKVEGTGGIILLYRSPDLLQWEYLKPLLTGNLHEEQPVWTGTMWECPHLLNFGNQHVLIFSIQATPSELLYPLVYIGTYRNFEFIPQTKEILTYGNYFYAPQIMRDEQGRYLMLGWLKEGRGQYAFEKAGWAGTMSLPIVVSLGTDGVLNLEPVPELEMLRQKSFQFNDLRVMPGDPSFLKEVSGNRLEISVEFSPETGEFEFDLLCSPNRQEQTRLVYHPDTQQIVLNRELSSLNTEVDHEETSVPIKLKTGEPLSLHIFLDHSVLEIFVNNRTYLASRIYPTREDSIGVDLVALSKDIKLKNLTIWSIASSWYNGVAKSDNR